jgi:hypothetical protein
MFIFALSAQLIVQYCFIDKDKNNEWFAGVFC